MGGDPGAVKLRPLKDEITDLPNLITLSRIALIPVILVLVDNYSPQKSAIAAVVFSIVAATDALDGYLARRLGLVTVLGKFLDPLADKLIVLATLVILVDHDRAPAWLVVLLMSRELAITGLRGIASSAGLVIAAGAGGKAKTALQLVGIAFLLIHFEYDLLLFDYRMPFHVIGINLLYVSLVMSVLSAIEYFRIFVRAAARQAESLAAQGITRAEVKARLRRARAENRAHKRRARAQRRADIRNRRRTRRQRANDRRRRRRHRDDDDH